MDPQGGKSSSARQWWLLIGGIVVFVVGFSLLESLVRTENGSTPAEDPGAAVSPAPPELRMLADAAIEIRHDFFRRSTIRLGNEDEAQVLFDCLARGFEQSFGDGTEGWEHRDVRRETQRIQDACLRSHDTPVPPRLPRSGGTGSGSPA